MSDDRLLDVREAAELLNIKPSTIYDWVRLGKIPHYRLGGPLRGPVRFRRGDLERFLEARRRGGSLAEATG